VETQGPTNRGGPSVRARIRAGPPTHQAPTIFHYIVRAWTCFRVTKTAQGIAVAGSRQWSMDKEGGGHHHHHTIRVPSPTPGPIPDSSALLASSQHKFSHLF
jgi:hypothetical protein